MQSIEKLFAVVDRKVDAFDFAIKKVKGKITGNEYYAVSGACIINGENFEKKVLTIGCPKVAIDAIVKAIVKALGTTVGISEATPVMKKVEAPKVTLTVHKDVTEEVAPGLRKITPTVVDEVDEIDEEDYEEVCEDCGEFVDECICDEENEDEEYEEEAPRLTLTPSRPSTPSAGPRECPYCSARIAPNFAYCPMCGGQQ